MSFARDYHPRLAENGACSASNYHILVLETLGSPREREVHHMALRVAKKALGPERNRHPSHLFSTFYPREQASSTEDCWHTHGFIPHCEALPPFVWESPVLRIERRVNT